MATNPLILLQGQAANVGQALDRRQNRLDREARREELTQVQDLRAERAERDRAQAEREARLGAEEDRIRSVSTAALEVLPALRRDPEEAARILEGRRNELRAEGIDSSDTDEAINMLLEGRFDELEGSLEDAVMVGERLGVIRPAGSGQRTPASIQLRDRLLRDAQSDDPEVRDSARRALGNLPRAASTLAERRAEDPELNTLLTRMEQEDARAAGFGRGVGSEEAARIGARIERGRNLAQGIPTLRRSLTLLDDVATGGLNRARLAASEFFGVTGADEGELSSNLGQAVLGQLRETFGAAFTEREGQRLEDLSASFGRNPEVNRRILANALQVGERAARRAIRDAERVGDFETAAEIEDLLTQELNPEAFLEEFDAQRQGPAEQATDEGVIMEDANGNRARVFSDGRIEEL